ncbi:MAG: hypothetical protein JNM27_22725 [Leptospirales bacterium]|nr:hypothetical protein [Leptospirales bacterium]
MRRLEVCVLPMLFWSIACVSLPEENKSGSDSHPVVNYGRNRIMDARDTGAVTGLLGIMGGIKLQLGPIGIGAFFLPAGGGHGTAASEYGWRHGELGDVYTTDYFLGFGFDESGTIEGRSYPRGKYYNRTYAEAAEARGPAALEHPRNYTRLGFAIGLGAGFLVEINPGEWLDLALGVFGLDVYGDDIYQTAKSVK